MDAKLIIKINYLILGLGLIIYAMYYLNRFGLGKTTNELLGIQQPQQMQRTVKAIK